MPATLSQIMVVPPTIPGVSGYVDTTVSITSTTGASAVAYTTLDGSTAFTFPATVSSPTTFYLPYTGTFTVSALIGSQQVATTAYTAATVSAINSAAAVVVECAAPRDNQEELTSRFASSKRGIWRPQGWGANLRAAVQTSQPVIGLIGDSITRGYYASDIGVTSSATSFSGKLRTYLQGLYGDGGSGFHGSRDNATIHSSLTGYTLPVTLTGTWADYSGTDGPGSQGMQTATTGSTMTTTVRGSTVKVYYITVSSGGTMDIAIDGGSAESVATAGSNGIGVYTKSGLSTGSHQIVITKTATNTGFVFVLGFSGTNATGAIVHNFSKTGGSSSGPAANASYGGGQWAGGNLLPCDLIIYGYGVNDAASNVAIDTYVANVRRYIAGVVDIANANKPGLGSRPTTPDPKNGAVDIMFHMPHVGKWEGTSEFYPEYLTRLRGLAEGFGAAMVDEWAIYRNSWNYFNSISGWGQVNGGTPGATGTDSVHPGDIGHNLYYLNIKAVLDEALAYTG